MSPYPRSGDAIHAYAAWHYTLGWGNAFTVTVALIAITSSVVISLITLRRNASHFEQSRTDARNDKLRAEVIDLISALSQRGSQVGVVIQRIRQLENVDRQVIHQYLDEMFAGDLWDSYAVCTLGVTAYDEHGHPLNKLDQLSPD